MTPSTKSITCRLLRRPKSNMRMISKLQLSMRQIRKFKEKQLKMLLRFSIHQLADLQVGQVVADHPIVVVRRGKDQSLSSILLNLKTGEALTATL
jgi:phage FluMu protein gp41